VLHQEQTKAIRESSVERKRPSGCRRSASDSLKYTDLPESMELATEPFNARELRTVKQKIHLLNNPSLRPTRLFRLPQRCRRVSRRPSLRRFAGCCLNFTYLSEISSDLRQSVGSEPLFRASVPRFGVQSGRSFSRVWKVQTPISPLFGILPLKRLSGMITRVVTLSRETFNAPIGTVVKSFFDCFCLGPIWL